MRRRVVSALILLPIVIYIVLIANFFVVRLILILVGCAGFFEWLMMDLRPFDLKKSLYMFFYVDFGLTILFFDDFLMEILFLIVVFHMIVGFYSLRDGSLKDDYYYFGGIFYVSLYFFAYYFMRMKNGRELLMLLFISIWAGDSFAYFCGRGFGRIKLSPLVSPNKTVEGAICGLIGGIGIGMLFGWVIRVGLINAFLVALVSNISGIFGDLAESVIKRYFGKKDSSNLIPGHGGILDRLDSFAFAVFFSYVVLKCRMLLF